MRSVWCTEFPPEVVRWNCDVCAALGPSLKLCDVLVCLCTIDLWTVMLSYRSKARHAIDTRQGHTKLVDAALYSVWHYDI